MDDGAGGVWAPQLRVSGRSSGLCCRVSTNNPPKRAPPPGSSQREEEQGEVEVEVKWKLLKERLTFSLESCCFSANFGVFSPFYFLGVFL